MSAPFPPLPLMKPCYSSRSNGAHNTIIIKKVVVSYCRVHYAFSCLISDNCEEGWRCPGCQNSSKVVPSVYKCFCGHVSNPGDRRGRGSMMVPHSCGEPCLKKLALSSSSSNCHHKCHQLCHPGPCPPCPVTVVRHCPCRKTRLSSP